MNSHETKPPSQQKRKRSASPPRPQKRQRSPSPPRPEKRQRSASPPRQRKRPGAGARIRASEREAYEARQRERAQEHEAAAQRASAVGADAVASHYNAVPQRGRAWRSTESAIRNLRSYNNWVKSTLIQKFAPGDEGGADDDGGGHGGPSGGGRPGLKVLDVGCGKGGDLQKWRNAPERVALYVGLDPAAVSVQQARGRYAEMARRERRGGALFRAEFAAKDCYGEWLGDVPVVREVGISEEVPSRWQEGGWDVVSMMFCLHYAFESEAKARGMLRNVAGALKKGGRLIGVMPNSDVLREQLKRCGEKAPAKEPEGAVATASDARRGSEFFSTVLHDDDTTNGKPEQLDDRTKPPEGKSLDDQTKPPGDKPVEDKPPAEPTKDAEPPADIPEWGNSLYRIRFPANTPLDGRFKPAFGWKYSYFLEEAVEELPEYVVPWEAFRALAEDFNLELQYRRPFLDVWDDDRNDPDLGPLSVRMKVTDYVGGDLKLSAEEREAVSLYHAFCFYKV